MAQIFLNNCYATLAQAITATDTQIELSGMKGFPTLLGIGDYFLLTLYADATRYGENIEVVKVTGLSGTTLTIERGFEGDAVSHSAGERVEARLTAATLDRMDQPNDWPSITDKPETATRWPLIDEITGLVDDLNSKVNTSDVVDGLGSTASSLPLSANQGRVLKGLIDNINTLLSSNDTTLDELQEIVDYIKVNRSDLENLNISAIAGLSAALDGKAASNHVHPISGITGLQNELDTKRGLTDTSFGKYDLDVHTSNAYIYVGLYRVTRVSVTANRTLAFLGLYPTGRAFTVVVHLHGVSMANYAVTWPSEINWADGEAPTLDGTRATVVLFWTGDEWVGSLGVLS